MLDLAAEKGVRSWVQEEQLSAEGCKRAVEAVKGGNVRYRYVLNAMSAFDRGAHVNGVSPSGNT